MVLIDTAGMAQQRRPHRNCWRWEPPLDPKLLVVNATAQGETIEDVLVAYQAQFAAA